MTADMNQIIFILFLVRQNWCSKRSILYQEHLTYNVKTMLESYR